MAVEVAQIGIDRLAALTDQLLGEGQLMEVLVPELALGLRLEAAGADAGIGGFSRTIART